MAEPEARVRLPQRTTRGKRLRAQIEAEEEQADNEFWNQDFFAEDAKDIDYASEKEEEDVPDSDFFESESEDDDDEEVDVREKPKKKALKPPGAPPSRPKPAKPPAAKVAKTPASASPSQAAAGGEAASDVLPQSVIFEATYEAPTLRKSTRERVEVAQKEREHRDQLAKSVRRPQKQGDYRVLTQEELLAEAARTELENLASLKQLLAQEEETKRKANVKKHRFGGPLVKFKSRGIEVLQPLEQPLPQVAAAAAAASYGLAAMPPMSTGWGIHPAVAAPAGMDAAAAAAATPTAADASGGKAVADAAAGQLAAAAVETPAAALSAPVQPAAAGAAPVQAANSSVELSAAGLQQPQNSTLAEPATVIAAALQSAAPPATAMPNLPTAVEAAAAAAASDSHPAAADDATAAASQEAAQMLAAESPAAPAPAPAHATAPPISSPTAVAPLAMPAAGGDSVTAPAEQAAAASADEGAPATVQAAAADCAVTPAGPAVVRQLLNTLQCFGMKAPKWLQPQRAPPPPGKPVCAITGLPARYKDPLTGHYYASLAAFRELRRRLGGPIPEAAPRKAAAIGSQHLLQPLPGSVDCSVGAAGSTAAGSRAGSLTGFPHGELQLQQLVVQQVEQHQALGSSHKSKAGRGHNSICYQQQQPAMPDEVAALVVGVSQMVHGAA